MIAAIETEYAGCRFRSRLEARWAVFFDTLGIRWHYEEEGYELPSGRYLPDFRLDKAARLASLDLWCEVKGKAEHQDVLKVLRAAVELPRRVPCGVSPQLLVLGEVPPPGQAWSHLRIDARGDLLRLQPVHFVRNDSGRWGTRPIGEDIWIPGEVFEVWGPEHSQPIADWFAGLSSEPDLRVDPDVDRAYQAARSARFEFGESGATL